MVSKLLFYPIIAIILLLTITEFVPTVSWSITHISIYQWVLYGMAIYFIMQRFSFFQRNDQWRQTFAHEFAHTIVSMMFFQKIHSFRAAETNGEIYHSGKVRFGDIFIGLAPYCLPYFTYIFLLLRIIGSYQMLYVFDLLIGFTLAFHIVCFWKQMRPYQIDIQRQGYLRSYLFIAAALVFNLTIILLSIRKGIVNGTTYLFQQYWSDMVGFWNMIF